MAVLSVFMLASFSSLRSFVVVVKAFFGGLKCLHVGFFLLFAFLCGGGQGLRLILDVAGELFDLFSEGILLGLQTFELRAEVCGFLAAVITVLACFTKLCIAKSFLGGLSGSFCDEPFDELLDETFDLLKRISSRALSQGSQCKALQTLSLTG